jgi:hypothetical protein
MRHIPLFMFWKSPNAVLRPLRLKRKHSERNHVTENRIRYASLLSPPPPPYRCVCWVQRPRNSISTPVSGKVINGQPYSESGPCQIFVQSRQSYKLCGNLWHQILKLWSTFSAALLAIIDVRMRKTRHAYEILVEKPKSKRPLGTCGHKWEDIIKMDLGEVSGCV